MLLNYSRFFERIASAVHHRDGMISFGKISTLFCIIPTAQDSTSTSRKF